MRGVIEGMSKVHDQLVSIPDPLLKGRGSLVQLHTQQFAVSRISEARI